jgi:hypothetical protein
MRQTIFIAAAALLAGLMSCDSGSLVTRASGLAYEIVVVMDKKLWDGNIGETVKDELLAPVPYLLQDEPSMRITYARPDQFDGLLKYVRNILIVNIDKSLYTKITVSRENDKWATGQAVVYINSPSELQLEAYLAANKGGLLAFYNGEEMKRAGNYLRTKYSQQVYDKAKEMFGIEIFVQSDIAKYKAGVNSLWCSNDARTGLCNLLIYSFPYTDKNAFTLDYLLAKRDSVAKALIPGSFKGSYMTTERRVVDFIPSTLNNKYCGIVRGWWKMEGDMMGGPFVSYARVDEVNRRVIVTEGFVYEPKYDKRKYLRMLEAGLRTTLLPGEQQTSEPAASPPQPTTPEKAETTGITEKNETTAAAAEQSQAAVLK